MSSDAVSWAWAQATGCQATKLTLVCLADEANTNDNMTTFSELRMCVRCEIDGERLRDTLTKLLALGFITAIDTDSHAYAFRVNFLLSATDRIRVGAQQQKPLSEAGLT